MENCEELIEYVPEACRDSEAGPAEYRGKIILESPRFEDRIGILETLAELDSENPARGKEEDELSIEEKRARIKFGMRALVKCVDLAKPFVRGVDIIRLNDGKRYESFDHLSRVSAFDGDLQKLVQVIAKSGALEGKTKPS
jgi:hypothetical protein